MQFWQVSVSIYHTLVLMPGRQLARWMVECDGEPQQSDFLAACEFFQIKADYPDALEFQKYRVERVRPEEEPAFENGGCRFWVLWRPGQTQRLS